MNIEQNSLSKVVLYLLESDNMQNKEKCLFFLYKYFNFLGDYSKDLWNECFSKKSFFSLFLHWSRFIRKIFYNILVYHYQKEPEIWKEIEEKVLLINNENLIYLKQRNEMRTRGEGRKRWRQNKFKNFRLKSLIVYCGLGLTEYQKCLQTEKFWKGQKRDRLPNLQLGLLRDDNEF